MPSDCLWQNVEVETHPEKLIKCVHVSHYMQNANKSSASFSKLAFVNSVRQAGTHSPFHVMTKGMRWNEYEQFSKVGRSFRSPRSVRSDGRLCFSLTCQIKRVKYLILVTKVRLFPAEMMTVMSAVTWLSDMVSQRIMILFFFFCSCSINRVQEILPKRPVWRTSLCKSVVQCDFSTLSGQPW